VFSKLLQRQSSLGLLKDIKMARTCSPITHLLFADDLLIFGKATSFKASTIKDCLDSYIVNGLDKLLRLPNLRHCSVKILQLRPSTISKAFFHLKVLVSNDSWLWKDILHCKSLLTSGACLQVSINSHFPIWTTSWIPTLPNFKPTSKFPSNKEQLSLFISTILSLFDDLSTQEILNIYISHSLSPKYIWTPATSGKFSISSAYLSILAINHPELIVTSSQPFWKHL
jgi:hypothetical protein